MKSLFKAIYDRFKNDPTLYAAVSGRMYLGRGPQEDLDKYIVAYLVDVTPNEEFAYAKRIEEAFVQFSIFCKGPRVDEICDIFTEFVRVYDRVVLTFSGGDYTCIEMSRNSANLIREEDDYWMYVVTYMVRIQPT